MPTKKERERNARDEALRNITEEIENALPKFKTMKGERATTTINLRVTPTRKRSIQQDAAKMGLKVSEYLIHLHQRAYETEAMHDELRGLLDKLQWLAEEDEAPPRPKPKPRKKPRKK